ncbi:hypothetical protein SLE2022_145240 [Rubroshorea leprosula]
MGNNLSLWCIILSLLIILMYSAKEMKGLGYIYDHLHQPEHSNIAKESHHTPSHMDHIDPSLNIFFRVDDFKVGKTLPIWFPSKDNPSTGSPPLLSREEADAIPFSTKQLPYLLDLFSFPKDSEQAKAMETTLKQCEKKPMKGETKSCLTSLESMLDFVQSVFGSHTHFKVLTPKFDKGRIIPLQNYTISEEPKAIYAPRFLGENGDRIKAPGICHMDTSGWDSEHIAFRLIKVKPRESPVCHVIPEDNLVWLPLH